MPIRFACPRCDKTLKVDDRFAGRRAKCPNCREPIEIPERSQERVRAGTAASEADAATSAPIAKEAAEVSDSADPPAAERSEVENAQAVFPAAASNGALEEMPPSIVDARGPSAASSDEDAAVDSAASTVVSPQAPSPPPFERAGSSDGISSPPTLPVASPPADEEDDAFASPFEVFDDDVEVIYAEGSGHEESERFLVSRTRVAIPRAYVYLQGALLVVVALLAFVIGWAFGGSGAGRNVEAPRGPVTLSGVVRVDGYDGPIAASEGALVAILPDARKPAEKIPVDGLRPDEIGRVVPPRTLGAIREMGGALAVSDGRGEFQAELSVPGDYHVLVVLPDIYRPSTSDIALSDLAKLGDYFLLPDQLIGECRYSLTTESVDESRSIVVRFP